MVRVHSESGSVQSTHVHIQITNEVSVFRRVHMVVILLDLLSSSSVVHSTVTLSIGLLSVSLNVFFVRVATGDT